MMIRRSAILGAILAAGCGVAAAQAPKAECSSFRRLSDGRWTSTIDAKIGNPKEFKRLQPGLPIERNLTIVGLNVSDTLDKLCGGK